MYKYNVEVVLNWGFVVEGSEVVLLDGEYHKLFQDFVTHHELLASS
jgi:hypothetical protein